MSEHASPKPVSPDAIEHGHEAPALRFRWFVWFVVIFVALLLLTALMVWGLAHLFIDRARQGEAIASPLAAIQRPPPQPPLQPSVPHPFTPAQDLQRLRAAEEQILHSYGWVDRSRGVVRIPIDRAMQLLVQRGQPLTTQPGPHRHDHEHAHGEGGGS